MKTPDKHMKANDELEKEYKIFKRTLANLETVRDIKEPYSIISRTGIVGLFNMCCDRAYIFIKDFLEFQGFIFPVTAFPQTIIRTAYEFGMLEREEIWVDIIETRNQLSHIHDEETAMTAIEKIKGDYLALFEKLDRKIDEKWLDKE